MVTGTTYDPANRLLSISGNALTESREYNTMGQLTQIISSASGGSSLNITYNYSSTQNNGKITSQTDNISGEQVVYAYDALNRLASAAATSGFWGQGYAYDGFGNLTDQTVTASSGGTTVPTLSVVYNASNNLQTTDCADANGNILAQSVAPWTCSNTPNGTEYTYDVENRLHPPTLYGVGSFYSYAPGGKRIWRGAVNSSSTITMDEVTFWSVTGQKLATYNILTAELATTNAYFGSRLIANSTGNVATDRLGSVGKYCPWGQEKPSATTNGTEKFTGYFRDAETGLDYADQRYHQPGMGRFMTADPYLNSAGPADPGSWNRYAYVRGDPANRIDLTGLDDDGEIVECDDPSCESEGYTNSDDEGGDDTCPYNTCVNVTDTTSPLSGLVFNPPVIAPNTTSPGVFGLIWGALRGVGGVVGAFFAFAPTGGADDTLVPYTRMDTAWIEANCTEVGRTTEPGRNYPGGESIEIEYLCPDGQYVWIQILTDKGGKQKEKHPRRWPKYPTKPPQPRKPRP